VTPALRLLSPIDTLDPSLFGQKTGDALSCDSDIPWDLKKFAAMSAKYAFDKSLKELRFLFCHTSPHSEATRLVDSPQDVLRGQLGDIILTRGPYA